MHVQELEDRARQLNEMANALRALADACDCDGRPDCPIIASLETGADVPACHAPPAPTASAPPAPRGKARPKR